MVKKGKEDNENSSNNNIMVFFFLFCWRFWRESRNFSTCKKKKKRQQQRSLKVNLSQISSQSMTRTSKVLTSPVRSHDSSNDIEKRNLKARRVRLIDAGASALFFFFLVMIQTEPLIKDRFVFFFFSNKN
jgi:hypothetical protein